MLHGCQSEIPRRGPDAPQPRHLLHGLTHFGRGAPSALLSLFRQVSQTQQLQEAQLKEFQATKKIECMLGGPGVSIGTQPIMAWTKVIRRSFRLSSLVGFRSTEPKKAKFGVQILETDEPMVKLNTENLRSINSLVHSEFLVHLCLDQVLQKCEEEVKNATLPKDLQISIPCPPAFKYLRLRFSLVQAVES